MQVGLRESDAILIVTYREGMLSKVGIDSCFILCEQSGQFDVFSHDYLARVGGFAVRPLPERVSFISSGGQYGSFAVVVKLLVCGSCTVSADGNGNSNSVSGILLKDSGESTVGIAYRISVRSVCVGKDAFAVRSGPAGEMIVVVSRSGQYGCFARVVGSLVCGGSAISADGYGNGIFGILLEDGCERAVGIAYRISVGSVRVGSNVFAVRSCPTGEMIMVVSRNGQYGCFALIVRLLVSGGSTVSVDGNGNRVLRVCLKDGGECCVLRYGHAADHTGRCGICRFIRPAHEMMARIGSSRYHTRVVVAIERSGPTDATH